MALTQEVQAKMAVTWVAVASGVSKKNSDVGPIVCIRFIVIMPVVLIRISACVSSPSPFFASPGPLSMATAHGGTESP